MLKKVKLKDAVGSKLAHDMTEIRPGKFKGAAFHKGHEVCDSDLCRLQKMGKNHLYVIDLEDDEIHEDQAAAILADALAGDGIEWKNEPREGKIKLLAGKDGLFSVNTTALAAFNMIDVRDAAQGHLLAADHGRIGERYILGGENLFMHEILALLSLRSKPAQPFFFFFFGFFFFWSCFCFAISSLLPTMTTVPC